MAGIAALGEDPSAWLTPAELDALGARGTHQRVAARIAGRVAAKRAICGLTGARPDEVRISNLASGEPQVWLAGEYGVVRVSISHRDGRAVAIASRTDRVGVDLEPVERRPESFFEDWFCDEERRLFTEDAFQATVVWCAKEAVLKALGVGMAASPRDVVVRALRPGAPRTWSGAADIELRGQARARHRELGGGRLQARWLDEGGGAIVFAVVIAA